MTWLRDSRFARRCRSLFGGAPSEAIRAGLRRALLDLARDNPFWSAPDIDGATWVCLDPFRSLVSARGARAGNWLVLCRGASRSTTMRLTIRPGRRGNIVVMGPTTAYSGSILIEGDDCLVCLGGDSSWPNEIELRLSTSKANFLWGRGSSSNGLRAILEGRAGSAVVGDDSMFARDTHLYTSDLHAVVDDTTGEWLNPPDSVAIENHVWIGHGAMIMKGAVIGSGSIVGARSVVTGEIPANSVASGAPARTTRRGVRWIRDREPLSAEAVSSRQGDGAEHRS